MPLAPNERLRRARKFVKKYSDERLNEQRDSQTYWNKFFHIFGIERESVAVFEYLVKMLEGIGRIDLFWPGTLIVEQKSPGRDLEAALTQAERYFVALAEADRPRYLLACDFDEFLLLDLGKRAEHRFKLADLPRKLGLFGFMDGTEPYARAEEAPVSVKASRLMSKIYLRLKGTGYGDEDAGYLLTRLAYVFFADDTGVFESGSLHRYLERRTAPDGHDLGSKLIELFQVLNTPAENRQSTLDADLAEFPYIDGALFERAIQIPAMDSGARKLLLEASSFDWNFISPAIFGSLFQSVLSAGERHDAGAHYTTEENIMKVISPLFLDDLRSEFEKIKARKDAGRKNALEKFRAKLAGLNFLDPACGAGNFLVVAYLRLRRLELDAIVEIHDPKNKRFDPAAMPKINVDQFYGIELNRFSSKIAETAMWMADHLANNEISAMYGDSYIRIPLEKKANVLNADALETDWNDVLPTAECSYILGNPPFLGSKVMSKEQKTQIKRITGKGKGDLDYVAAWFVKAAQYTNEAEIGFVATSSISRGEQVGILWPIVYGHGLDIVFAHRPFKWGSDAPGMAQVRVIVVGMGKRYREEKRLTDGYVAEYHAHISPYITGSPIKSPIVSTSTKELNGLPDLAFGTQPIDGGYYIFTDQERDDFLKNEPSSEKFFARFVNAKELINGNPRWILDLHGAEPSELRGMPHVQKRIEAVKRFREASGRKETRELAKTPLEFAFRTRTTEKFLVVPSTSSENRQYVPIDFMPGNFIASNATMVIREPTIQLFGLLTSKMHMAWLRTIGGRLENRLRYSAGIVYNTFPVPDDFDSLAPHAQNVLDTRATHSGQTLADLYGPNIMPTDLRRAHEKLDKAVDRLYRKEPFKDDHERLEFLLGRYGAMVQKNQKLIPEPKRRRRRAKRRA